MGPKTEESNKTTEDQKRVFRGGLGRTCCIGEDGDPVFNVTVNQDKMLQQLSTRCQDYFPALRLDQS